MIRDYSRKSDPKIHLIYCIDVGRYVEQVHIAVGRYDICFC